VAVAFDAAGPSSSGKTGTTSPTTWSHTCTGSNLFLAVFLSCDNRPSTDTVTATYAGTPMTEIGRRASGGGTVGFVVAFGLAAPASGANTVSVTTGSGGSALRTGGSLSFTGADQSTGFANAATADSAGANQTSGSVAVTGTTSGNIVACGATSGSGGSGGMAASGAATRQYATNHGAAAGAACDTIGETATSGGGTVTMSWTQFSDFWGGVAFEVLAAAAGTDSGPNSPSTGTDLGGGTGTWTSPGNITADDGSAATWAVV
jgi:hypothetical protein